MDNQERAGSQAEQDVMMQDIQGMIENLVKSTVGKIHKRETEKLLDEGNQAADSVDDIADSIQVNQMDLAEIKAMLGNLQQFLDNVNKIIAQLEDEDAADGENVLLDDYIATADNILEMVAFSAKDVVTGLSNRHGFDNRLTLEWNRALREGSPLCLLIFAVDGFDYNDDKYTREQRDDVIKTIAKTLETSIKRSCDFLARWSDEEFAALLPLTEAEGAMIVAKRIRAAFENVSIPFIEAGGGKISVCIGFCVHKPVQNERVTGFIAKAQNALNKAKEAGQNKVVWAK